MIKPSHILSSPLLSLSCVVGLPGSASSGARSGGAGAGVKRTTSSGSTEAPSKHIKVAKSSRLLFYQLHP